MKIELASPAFATQDESVRTDTPAACRDHYQGADAMIHCFLTGVEFGFEEAFVLNRRQAHDLLDTLKDRVVSLKRVIDQLSPLDEIDRNAAVPHPGRRGSARKKHRLVCKAIADALAPGFPEIRLFLPWPEYRTQARRAFRRERCSDTLFGDSPQQCAASTVAENAPKRLP